MPGNRVGTLYVLVQADTSKLEGQIERQLTNAGKDIGEKNGTEFEKAWNKRIKRGSYFDEIDRQAKSFFKDLPKDAQKAFQTGDLFEIEFDTSKLNKFAAEARDKFGEEVAGNVENDLSAALERAFKKGIEDARALAKAQKDITRKELQEELRLRNAAQASLKRQRDKAEQQAVIDEAKRQDKVIRDRIKAFAKAASERLAAEKKANDALLKEWERQDALTAKRAKEGAARVEKELKDIRFADAIEKEAKRAFASIPLEAFKATGKMDFRFDEKFRESLRTIAKDTDRTFEQVANAVSRRMGDALRDWDKDFVITTNRFGVRWRSATKNFGADLESGFTKAFKNIGGGFADLIKGIGSGVRGLPGRFAGFFQLLSSMEVQIAVLVTGFSRQLVGAIAGAIPLATGLGVAIGGAALAAQGVTSEIQKLFKGLDKVSTKAADKFIAGFKDLAKEAKSLKKTLQDALFTPLKDLGPALARITKNATPGIELLVKTFGEGIKGWVDALEDIDLNRLFKALQPALKTLLSAGEPAIRAISNLILLMTPAAEELAKWIVKIAEAFEDWTKTNVADKKDQFRTMGDEAGEFLFKLVRLGKELINVFTIFGNLGLGDLIIDVLHGIADAFEDLNKPTKEFKNGQLTQIFKDLGKAIHDAFADPKLRDAFVQALKDITQVLSDMVKDGSLQELIKKIPELVTALLNLTTQVDWKKLTDNAIKLTNALTGLVDALTLISNSFSGGADAKPGKTGVLGGIGQLLTMDLAGPDLKERFHTAFDNIFGGLDEDVKPHWDKLKADWNAFWTDLPSNLETVGQTIGTFWDQTFGQLVTKFSEFAGNAIQGFKDGWDEWWAGVKIWVDEKWDAFIGWVKEKLGIESPSTVFMEIAGDVIQGFVDGLVNKWNELWGMITAPFRGLINFVKNLFGVHSPSTVFDSIGADVAQGFLNGFKRIFDGIGTFLSGIKNTITTWATNTKNTLKSVWEEIKERAKDAAGTVARSFRPPTGIIPRPSGVPQVAPQFVPTPQFIPAPRMASSRLITNNITVNTVGADPRAIAQQVVNRAAVMAS